MSWQKYQSYFLSPNYHLQLQIYKILKEWRHTKTVINHHYRCNLCFRHFIHVKKAQQELSRRSIDNQSQEDCSPGKEEKLKVQQKISIFLINQRQISNNLDLTYTEVPICELRRCISLLACCKETKKC